MPKRFVAAEGTHCNNFLCEIFMRQMVRTIASMFLYASYGKTAKPKTKRIKKFLTDIPTSIKCEVVVMSSGLLISCHVAAAINGKSTIMVTTEVQNHESSNTHQPNKRSKVNASGVTLRLRLSNIFHLDNPDNLFFVKCPLLSCAKGNIHAAICQSPLVHR